MLTIRCDQGALSLAGAIPASLFRNWCLNSLGEVIRLHHTFQADAAAIVTTLKLASTAEMARFTSLQKECLHDLIVALLTVIGGVGADLWPLTNSPLELAAVLGGYVTVQVPFQCLEPGCNPDEELLFACESCGKNDFILQRASDGWELVCREHGAKRWAGQLPLKLSCPNDHRIELSEKTLADVIDVVPGSDLLCAIADIINSYLKGYHFDPAQETFFVHGHNLWYFPDRGKVWARIQIIQNIGINLGTVIGGQINRPGV